MRVHRPPTKRARIEMLPLIDIVFLLLVFFIYAMLSMTVHRGVAVNLPASSTAEVDKRLLLTVSVDAAGTVFLDKRAVALRDLSTQLAQRASGETDPGVLLFADRSVTYQFLFTVLDRINAAGIQRVSLQAEAE